MCCLGCRQGTSIFNAESTAQESGVSLARAETAVSVAGSRHSYRHFKLPALYFIDLIENDRVSGVKRRSLKSSCIGRLISILKYALLVLITGMAHAQGGFSKFYHLPGSQNSTANDAMETPDHKYLVCGRTDTLVGGYIISRLTLMATDLAGNKLWTRSYGDLNLDYPDYFQRNQFYCADQNQVHICCTGRDQWGKVFSTLTKINYDGDTIWQKQYFDASANVVPQVLIRAVDGGFYMTAYYMPHANAGERPIALLRISENGDLLWQKVINKAAPNVMSGSDMVQDSASRRLIITGYQDILGGTYNNLLILDSIGNKITQKVFNDGCGGGGLVIQMNDDNFLTGVQMNVNCANGIFQAKLVKFNIHGNIIWEKLMNPAGPINSIDPIAQKLNRDIICLGAGDSSFVRKMQYTLLDSLGNMKMIAYYGRLKDVFDSDGGRGGSFTSDGGYIKAVQLTGEPSPTPFYIIKLDSMGCDTTPEYCEWERTVSLKEQKQTLQAEVFPNPCQDVINVGIAGDGLPATITVFDQSGRKVLMQAVSRSKNALDVSILPDGFYLMEARSPAGVFRKSFVVQH